MKDLSEKRTPNTLKWVEMGMSKKKGTKDANITPKGPGVIKNPVDEFGSTKPKECKYLGW